MSALVTQSARSATAKAADSRQSLLFDVDGQASLQSTIVAAAVALGAKTVRGWSAAEESLACQSVAISKRLAETLCEQIRSGEDPLGAMFYQLRSAPERREKGATFTPLPIVEAMVNWGAEMRKATRVVD